MQPLRPFLRLICCCFVVGAITSRAGADLLVSSRLSNQILRYTDAGAPIGIFADGNSGLFTPNGLALGSDGWVYAASRDGGQILRYDAGSGAFGGVFAQGPEMVGPS